MSQPTRKHPVGVVPRKEAVIPDALLDGPTSMHYCLELDGAAKRPNSSGKARGFRQLAFIGSTATIVLSLIDSLRLDR